MSRKLQIILGIIVAVIVAAGVVWLFALRDNSDSPAKTPRADKHSTSQPSTNAPTVTEPKTYNTKVYFSKHPDSDNDPTKVFSVARTSPDAGVANFALRQLIAGPTATEKASGYFSDVRVRSDPSNCGGADVKVSIADTRATVQFCRSFDAVGTLSDARANETIRATLLQFPTIKSVVVLNKGGHCQFDMSGEDRCLMQ
jgi:hypothetical protein